MFILLGLGNPGPRYLSTRHNIGFRVVDQLSRELKIPLYKVGHHSYYGQGQAHGRDVVLAKPMTYMNRSGLAALALCRHFGVLPENLLVIYDDLELPPGKIRLRGKGGSGGHNGMGSIIYHLATEEFPRLRIGIGRPEAMEVADYVLSPFSPAEEEIMADTVTTACSAVSLFLQEGIEAAMNRFNSNKS